MLCRIPAKQTSDVDLVLVPQEFHCPAPAQSLCFCVAQYSILKLQMQTGRSCKKTARLALTFLNHCSWYPVMPHSLARRSGSHELPWQYEPQFWVTDNSSCTGFSGKEDRQDWNCSGEKWIKGLFLSLIHSTWAERAWSHEACASFCSSTHNFGLLILFAVLHKLLLKKIRV